MFIPLMLLCKIYRIHVRIEVPPSSDKKLVLVPHIWRVCHFVYQLGGNLHFAQVQTAKKQGQIISKFKVSPWRLQNFGLGKKCKTWRFWSRGKSSKSTCCESLLRLTAQSDSRVAVALTLVLLPEASEKLHEVIVNGYITLGLLENTWAFKLNLRWNGFSNSSTLKNWRFFKRSLYIWTNHWFS